MPRPGLAARTDSLLPVAFARRRAEESPSPSPLAWSRPGVHLEKVFEDLLCLVGRDADATVGHAYHRGAPAPETAD
jgi:hypothetical protein